MSGKAMIRVGVSYCTICAENNCSLRKELLSALARTHCNIQDPFEWYATLSPVFDTAYQSS
jgi:hypothetical protein